MFHCPPRPLSTDSGSTLSGWHLQEKKKRALIDCGDEAYQHVAEGPKERFADDCPDGFRRAQPVSYTHLTLPTICSV
eukprot:6226857-Alexandrium_andersonii.AAC.1